MQLKDISKTVFSTTASLKDETVDAVSTFIKTFVQPDLHVQVITVCLQIHVIDMSAVVCVMMHHTGFTEIYTDIKETYFLSITILRT